MPQIGPNEEHVPWKALCAFDGIPFPVDSTCPPEELPLRYVTTLHELQHLVLDLLGEKYPPGTRIKTRKLPRLVNRHYGKTLSETIFFSMSVTEMLEVHCGDMIVISRVGGRDLVSVRSESDV